MSVRLYDIIDRINIIPRAQKLLEMLMEENPEFASIIKESVDPEEANNRVYEWVMAWLEKDHQVALDYFNYKTTGWKPFKALTWREVGAIRLLDYVKNRKRVFENLYKKINESVSDPIRIVWMGYHRGKGGGKPEFFMDMIHLLRQFTGSENREKPDKQKVLQWMDRHSTGLEPSIVKMREENRRRILKIIIKDIDSGEIKSSRYKFIKEQTEEEKMNLAIKWWDEYQFHLKFAIRTPEKLNEMLGYSLDPDRMYYLKEARKKEIPFFINPYYLSLLNVNTPVFARQSDLAIRDYVLYSKELIREFGNIVAWEKEDKVEPGKPNAAGWLLPNDSNIHRRYPEVAILIPDTVGRACGGLCVSCQRMYDFQRGRLNFNLLKLEPKESWKEKLNWLMTYFENDSQLRDILITGGDSFMSSDSSLQEILDAIYNMALLKIEQNKSRPEGQKYAEMIRVRLGTRLPVYIPQRITESLLKVLVGFKEKASKIGIRQFIIQTHFVSPMEITPETREAVRKLNNAGWVVFNQMVYTAAASRRGYAASLRRALNDIGVLTYYTFSIKGYMENHHNFATNARSIQEQAEEKVIGLLSDDDSMKIQTLPNNSNRIRENIAEIRKNSNLPFLATDRNIMNLPGVGKSLSFRTIGITRRGRRILEFEHDRNRGNSPIIEKMGKINIIESKPILRYLMQMEEMGEDPEEYKDLWGYSIGETETRSPVFEYPDYSFKITEEITNIDL